MKQMTRAVIWMVVMITPLFLTGCATPESRINKNPELFAIYPPEAQNLIQQGKINLGFTSDMVTMAMGQPNRIYTRATSGETIEVWSYTAKTTTMDRQRVNADFRYRDSSGRTRTTTDSVWVDVARETEYERFRVEFKDGKVSAIDTLQP